MPSKYPEKGGCVHSSTLSGLTGTTSMHVETHFPHIELCIRIPWWAAKSKGFKDSSDPSHW